jgi:hypothetical protein
VGEPLPARAPVRVERRPLASGPAPAGVPVNPMSNQVKASIVETVVPRTRRR